MTDVEAANSAGEVDVAIAVDVFDRCAIGARGENGRGVGRTAWDRRFATRHQRARTRTWNFRSNLNRSHFLFLFCLAAAQTMSASQMLIPADGGFVEIDEHLLGFEILLETPGAKFTSEARLFVATPGRFDVRRLDVIYP